MSWICSFCFLAVLPSFELGCGLIGVLDELFSLFLEGPAPFSAGVFIGVFSGVIIGFWAFSVIFEKKNYWKSVGYEVDGLEVFGSDFLVFLVFFLNFLMWGLNSEIR